jgi:hypothetical protein
MATQSISFARHDGWNAFIYKDSISMLTKAEKTSLIDDQGFHHSHFTNSLGICKF